MYFQNPNKLDFSNVYLAGDHEGALTVFTEMTQILQERGMSFYVSSLPTGNTQNITTLHTLTKHVTLRQKKLHSTATNTLHTSKYTKTSHLKISNQI